MKNKQKKGTYLVARLFFKLYKVLPTSTLQQVPSLLSPHSFQVLRTQSPTTLNLGPIGFQALVMEGSASTKEG